MAQQPLVPPQTPQREPKRPWIRLQASIICPICNMEQVITTGIDAREKDVPSSMLEMTRFAFNQHLRAKHADEEEFPQYFIQR